LIEEFILTATSLPLNLQRSMTKVPLKLARTASSFVFACRRAI